MFDVLVQHVLDVISRQHFYEKNILAADKGKVNDKTICSGNLIIMLITCITLAKAGLLVGPLHPSVCPLVCQQHFWGA